jgi:hypothetical protein
LVKRRDVGGHDHVHLKPRMFEANRDVVAIDQQPIAALGGAAEVELNEEAPPLGASTTRE